ncbi:MAG: hypothetical protein V4732_12845 [Pseudomonadota bacterium]
MNKILFSFLGAVLAGAICNILFWSTGQLALTFDIRLYNSEEEASRNFLIYLFLFFISVISGSIYGYYIAKKIKQK